MNTRFTKRWRNPAKMKNDLIVVGAGAAGLMAAGTAARRGLRVLLLERNARPARKVMITGKGRCNVTNVCPLLNDLIANVPVNGRFLYGAFSRFMPSDTMDFFEEQGVPLKIERGNRVFPESDRAVDIVDALCRYASHKNVALIQGRVTQLLMEEGRVCGAATQDGEPFFAPNVLLATGGLSYPGTGSTGDGYALARKIGHTIVEPRPSLVPVNVHEGWCSELQGLALKNIAVAIRDTDSFRTVYTDFGELLFTHFGLSGPVILSASAHMRQMRRGRYEVHIDLKPALDDRQLDIRLQRDFLKNANRVFANSLDALLPRKLIPVIVRLSGIAPGLKVNQVTKEMRQNLAALLKDLTLTVTSFRPIEEAIVTSGGVSTKEINAKTMESKLLPGLYFAGELIDVDGYTGGFNLQIAFSTGHLAGQSVKQADA